MYYKTTAAFPLDGVIKIPSSGAPLNYLNYCNMDMPGIDYDRLLTPGKWSPENPTYKNGQEYW
jgi:hypothetical protein